MTTNVDAIDLVASLALVGAAIALTTWRRLGLGRSISFADPNVAPAIEVVFLNGVTEPFTDSEEGWRVDGVEWKVRHDYGVGAVNYRSAYKQPGA